MENKLTESIRILPSSSDYAQILSYPDIYALFQDIAVKQSELLKFDAGVLTPKGLFWVIAKSKVRISRRPAQGEVIELSTWPQKPERIRGRRNYTIEKAGERLIEATTEWVVLDRNQGRFYLLNDLYEDDFEFNPEKILPEDFYRFSGDFSGEPFAEYTVRSIDIDFEGHMNNVAYARALFGLFRRAELEELDPKTIEFQYRLPCFEGDRLLWYKRTVEQGLELCAKLPDQTGIFFARLLK